MVAAADGLPDPVAVPERWRAVVELLRSEPWPRVVEGQAVSVDSLVRPSGTGYVRLVVRCALRRDCVLSRTCAFSRRYGIREVVAHLGARLRVGALYRGRRRAAEHLAHQISTAEADAYASSMGWR